MRLSDKKIRQIIREEIGRRYGLLNEKENEKDLGEAGGVGGTLAAMGAGAAVGAKVGAVSGGGVFSWLTAPVGAALGGLVGGIAYTSFSKGDTSEISADAKTAAAFLQEDPDAFNKVEEAQKTGGMAGLELVSSSDRRRAAAALNDAIKGMGTDEEAIAETLNSLPTILDISGVSSIYADLYNKSLLDALAGDLGSKELRRYVHRVIDDKPFAMIGGKKIDTYAEMGEALEAGDEEAEEVAEEVIDKGIKRLQQALGNTVTGQLTQDDLDAIRYEIRRSYEPQEGQPSKKDVAMDIQARVQNISEQNPLGRGGQDSLLDLGYRGARTDYWGAVADFVTNKGAAAAAPVAEAKKNLKVKALIRSLVKNNLKNRVLREQLTFDMSGFEDEVTVVEPEPGPGAEPGETKPKRRRSRGKPEVRELQKIVGSKADGIWGPKTQAAFNEFVKNKSGTLGGEWVSSAASISGNWASGASRASELSGQSFSANPAGALAFAKWLGGGQAASARGGSTVIGGGRAHPLDPRPAVAAQSANVSARVEPAGAITSGVLDDIRSLVGSIAKKPGRVTITRRQAVIQVQSVPRGVIRELDKGTIRGEIRQNQVPVGTTISVTVKEA